MHYIKTNQPKRVNYCDTSEETYINKHERRFEIPIMHMDKKKQKEYILKELESGDYNEDDADELFDEIEYESKKLEEIESFAFDNILTDDEGPEELENKIVETESSAVCLAVMEEIPTEKKEELFANELEELGCTNLVKHMIKTQDTEPIKQPPYWLALNEQEFFLHTDASEIGLGAVLAQI
ncbi:15304_t:CDS:2 [Cetraspora pellucida]|uniref:15304_t:CDS:1 n=1 Tax=Cetraspora pellucida TaxID=1433469 RepID=A0ACA9JX14_9GLOM|nr:15304_t:CDS:2 [Cetraspora pellucida]